MGNTVTNAGKHFLNHGKSSSKASAWVPEHGTIEQFQMTSLTDQPMDFAQYKGKVLLLTNVASACGYTKGAYTEMVRLHETHGEKGFEVIAFPCNQFGSQENKSSEEICTFTKDKYRVTFPLTEKIEVNGEKSHPIYQWLKKSFPGEITWNFSAKFIIDQEGRPIARFEKESWEDIEKFVVALLEKQIKFEDIAEAAKEEATKEEAAKK